MRRHWKARQLAFWRQTGLSKQSTVCLSELKLISTQTNTDTCSRHNNYEWYALWIRICRYRLDSGQPADAAVYATGARRTLQLHVHSPDGSTFLHTWCRSRRVESVMSNRKSDSVTQCVFTWRTILLKFIPIWFETTEPRAFLKSVAPTRTTTTRWLIHSFIHSIQ